MSAGPRPYLGHWCSRTYPRSMAPSTEALERLTEVARSSAAGRLASVEVVSTSDPQTAEPMWVAVIWIRPERPGDDARELRQTVLESVHEAHPGEWFGRLIVQVRDEGATTAP